MAALFGTTQAVPHRDGAGLVAGAGQVVAHVVEVKQAVDLDQTIAIGIDHLNRVVAIDIGRRSDADAGAVYFAAAGRGGQLKNQGNHGVRHGKGRGGAIRAPEGDYAAFQLPPIPGYDGQLSH